MQVNGVLETAVYVDDLDAAERFYQEVLGLQVHSKTSGRHAFFYCGEGILILFNPEQTQQKTGPVPVHGARGPGHVAFTIAADSFADWRKQLEKHGVDIETEVEWEEGGRSIYFRDPAGNSLELTTPEIWGLESGV